ncbi:MAG: twin-arginine translocase subunit TatC, partial [bacterium]
MARDREKQMSFLEHLEELRWTVIWIIVATVAASAGGWYFADRIITFLGDDLAAIVSRTYGPAEVFNLHVFDVSEAFVVKFKVALLVGLL